MGPSELQRLLRDWYARARRTLPWRAPAGARAEPYRVWLSEIMLQQTTVAAVAPYYNDFVGRWPSVRELAAAELDQILHAWQGLGYYARARNLLRCARIVAGEYGGEFPEHQDALLRLPGIGPYTAAAIAAIAFDRKAAPVDGNVERVMARLHGVATPLPAAKRALAALAAALVPDRSPGDHAQALMDLGATVCTPRKPACGRCPWSEPCVARAQGNAETLPRRTPKPERPTRRGVAFWAIRGDGEVLLRRRPENGLLGGMMEIPSTGWRAPAWTPREAMVEAPFDAEWRMLPGAVRHTFTHFHLELAVMTAAAGGHEADGVWCPLERLGEHALPSVMKKIIRHALAQI